MAKKHGYQGKTRHERNSRNSKQDNRRSANLGNIKGSGDNKGAYSRKRKSFNKISETGKQKYNYNSKPFNEETVEDILADIMRIQKEISLEIKEIKSLKL